MSLPFKLGVGVLTIGTVTGVSYLVSTYLMNSRGEEIIKPSGKKLSKLIEEKYEYILLDSSSSGDQQKWTENWQSYRTNGQNVFNLTGWEAGNNRLDLTLQLKEECKKLSETTVLDEANPLYGNVTKYCGRGVTLEEQAKKDNLEVLNTSTEEHASIWTQKFNNKEQLDAELKKIGIATTPSDANGIKTGCATAKSQNKQITDYVAVYKAYKSICTKQKN